MSKVNNIDNNHCVKSARIRRYSRLYFPAFGLNNSEYGHFSRSEETIILANICLFNVNNWNSRKMWWSRSGVILTTLLPILNVFSILFFSVLICNFELAIACQKWVNQPTFICSKSIMKTGEQYKESVQS